MTTSTTGSEKVKVPRSANPESQAPLGGRWFPAENAGSARGRRVPMRSCAILLSLAFALLELAAPSAGARDWFVSPAGAGQQDGANWENAASGSAGGLQRLADQLQPGDRLLLGSGEYRDAKLVVQRSGTVERPITILGQDRGGGLPVFASNWALAKPAKGLTAIAIAPGASHVTARDLVIRGYQHGVRGTIAPGETPRAGWRFENVDMDHLRHGFYLSGFSGLRLSGCDLKRYSKHGFRFEEACVDVTIERCIADCSEGDAKWEEQTELFPFGFNVNDGGAPNRNFVFEGCIARNNLMPLQKTRYKNGDGFVVESNAENVAFKGCRSLRNQDGGFDLKVKDARLDDCVAIGNKRNFRIWKTGHLANCFSGLGNEGIWTKGGPVVAERCTIAEWKNTPASTEDATVGIELRKCLLAANGTAKRDAAKLKLVTLVDCVQAPDLAAAGLAGPSETWDGDAPELNSSKHPDHGYRAK